jgi:hypothetical protein
MLLYFTFIDVIRALLMPLDTQLHSTPIPPKNRFLLTDSAALKCPYDINPVVFSSIKSNGHIIYFH